MLTYKDYPSVPDYLVEKILKEVNCRQQATSPFSVSSKISETAETTYGKLITEDLNIEGLAKMNMFSLEDLTQWAQENIKEEFNAIHIQYFENGKFFFPHIDLLRSKAVNYLIKTGDAVTAFYKPNGFTPTANTVIPYDKITLIEEHKIKACCWHEIDVTQIHSIENLKDVRIAVTLSIV